MQERKYSRECPQLPPTSSSLSFSKRFPGAQPLTQRSPTFQGSEERTVVYVVGHAGRQHWQHVYTAVTRGRCRVYVVAEERHLKRAVKNKEIPRKTRLQRFLREAIAETNSCPTQMASPLVKCWQSQELETQSVSVTQGASGPPELHSDLVIQEWSSVLNKEQMGSLQQSPCKRQIPASEDVTERPPVSISLLKKFKTSFCTLFHHCMSLWALLQLFYLFT